MSCFPFQVLNKIVTHTNVSLDMLILLVLRTCQHLSSLNSEDFQIWRSRWGLPRALLTSAATQKRTFNRRPLGRKGSLVTAFIHPRNKPAKHYGGAFSRCPEATVSKFLFSTPVSVSEAQANSALHGSSRASWISKIKYKIGWTRLDIEDSCHTLNTVHVFTFISF